MDCEEQHRFRLATLMFQGEAEHLWKPTKEPYFRQRIRLLWKIFLEKFYDNNFPNFVADKRGWVYNTHSGRKDGCPARNQILRISSIGEHSVSDAKTKARMRGLKPAIDTGCDPAFVSICGSIQENAVCGKGCRGKLAISRSERERKR